jgi:hypothetical protein
MDRSTQVKVLARLVLSNTRVANSALRQAFDQAARALSEATHFEELEYSLAVMTVVGVRYSREAVAALDGFVRSIESRRLVHSSEYGELTSTLSKYRNAQTLISKSIEVLSVLRYLETPAVLDSLLWASTHESESVRKDAIPALSQVAKYNLSVYSGQGLNSGSGIGAAPQLQVIASLESRSDRQLTQHLRGVLTLLEGLLSTSMESARWSSNAVTLSRAVTPADPDVANVRVRSIAQLRRLYRLVDTKAQKLSVIQVMNSATRVEARVDLDGAYRRMISANAREVLAFYAEIVKGADLQIVQKTEHYAYWVHYHAISDEVRAAALQVKKVIDSDKEYEIYKTLVGFEGIFGDWSRDDREASLGLASQDARLKAARAYVSRLADEGFDVWRRRILRFAETESNDLATFPVFYEFVGQVGSSYPKFALHLLADHAMELSRVLIPMLRGLWDSEMRREVQALMRVWIQQAQAGDDTLLYASAKLFLSTKAADVDFLNEILARSAELKDAAVLRQIVSVAIARFAADEAKRELKDLFLRSLGVLTELRDASWVSEVWFRKDAKLIVGSLTAEERRDVLNNLLLLPQIDYQAEDVLAAIAEHALHEVVEFFCVRMYGDKEGATASAEKKGVEFEEIPYQFHTLQDQLSRDPRAVVHTVLTYGRHDPSLFEFRGAKLLQNIFPQFSEGFQTELIRLLQEGGDTEQNLVASVLRAYGGEAFIQPVAKELIKRVPLGSPILSDIEMALQATGVVSGEYGMVEAYEQKRLEVLDWLQDPSDRLRTFARSYIAYLEAMRDSERARAEEAVALRKFQYGEG